MPSFHGVSNAYLGTRPPPKSSKYPHIVPEPAARASLVVVRASAIEDVVAAIAWQFRDGGNQTWLNETAGTLNPHLYMSYSTYPANYPPNEPATADTYYSIGACGQSTSLTRLCNKKLMK